MTHPPAADSLADCIERVEALIAAVRDLRRRLEETECDKARYRRETIDEALAHK